MGKRNYLLDQQKDPILHFPRKVCYSSTDSCFLGFLRSICSFSALWNSRSSIRNCAPDRFSDSFVSDQIRYNVSIPVQDIKQNEIDVVKILKGSNSILPHVILASRVLALIFPPSFTWFTNRCWDHVDILC